MIIKHEINKVTITLSILMILLLIVLLLLVLYKFAYAENLTNFEQKKIVLKLLGISSLTLSADCISTRNPIEGIYDCLSDIPGGYCYHSSCDVVCVPDFSDDFSFKLTISKAAK